MPNLIPSAEEVKGKWVPVRARNPQTVCCDEALMVCAMRTVGVALHPVSTMAYMATIEDVNGEVVRTQTWLLGSQSVDGLYKTADLMAWWNDPAWVKAHPEHEFAVVMKSLRNMGVQAAEMRARQTRVVVRRGRSVAYIPVNASAGKRAHMIGQLEGRIPMNTPFVEDPGS